MKRILQALAVASSLITLHCAPIAESAGSAIDRDYDRYVKERSVLEKQEDEKQSRNIRNRNRAKSRGEQSMDDFNRKVEQMRDGQ